MTAAFGAIDRRKLLDNYHNVSENDENRMIRSFLSSIYLLVKVNFFIFKEDFSTKFVSPQDDEINGINFSIRFRNALKEIR